MKVTRPEPIFGFRVIPSVKPIREDSYVWRAHSRGVDWYKFSYGHGITPISGPHFTLLAPISSPPITIALPSSKGHHCLPMYVSVTYVTVHVADPFCLTFRLFWCQIHSRAVPKPLFDTTTTMLSSGHVRLRGFILSENVCRTF